MRKSAFRFRKALIILLLSGAVAAMLLPLFPSLTVVAGNELVFAAPLTEEHCEVQFRHSVNKGHIREVYRIQNGLLTLENGYFQSYGAGMLDTVTETDAMNFRQEGDYFVLDFPENWQKSIGYIAGETAGHVFLYSGRRLELGKTHTQKRFVLEVKRLSLWQVICIQGG